MGSSLSARRRVVDAYFAAINSDRFADLAPLFAEDVQIHTVGAPVVTGRTAALAHFPKVLANYAEHDDRVTRVIEAPDAIVTEIDFRGALTDGRPVVFSALDVFDFASDVIGTITTWYDTHLVRRQVMPPRT